NRVPGMVQIAADEYYTTEAGLNNLALPLEKNSYLWQEDIYEGIDITADWNLSYEQVFYANVVLDGLQGVSESAESAEYTALKGTALFFRGAAFFNLAQSFAAPFDASSAASLPGIPVRITSDVNIKTGRGTLAGTYDQIIKDLSAAADLLPDKVSVKSRPSKLAALAILARVYLIMGDFGRAEDFADQVLQLNNQLIDYNTISATAASPFPEVKLNQNPEAIFYSDNISYSFLSSSLTSVDSNCYRSYASNDLRRGIFFRTLPSGVVQFKGSYSASATKRLFAGPATDEVYLIRAEARARNGNVQGAMEDLNALLVRRFKTGTFTPMAASSEDEALSIILAERRKELIGRGLRWSDLRRLNKDPRFASTITRDLGGEVYSLAPGSNRYVFPIPASEIAGSGIEQNPR
ncbi:MAG TPA: RagB/SusD family nutrient uptake outer membrane protein, partial [Sphingobacteriaceae bacterium]